MAIPKFRFLRRRQQRIWIRNTNGLLNEKRIRFNPESPRLEERHGREGTCFSSSLRKRARNKTSKELGREKTPSLLVTAFFSWVRNYTSYRPREIFSFLLLLRLSKIQSCVTVKGEEERDDVSNEISTTEKVE